MERIYISAIEGVESHAPVNAKRLTSGDYQIAEDGYFDFTDFTLLPEFIPGDIVSVERRGKELFATKLISPSLSPEKKYIELRRRIILEELPVSQEIITKYATEINRLLVDYPAGDRFGFYPVQQWVDMLRAMLRL